MKRFFLLLFFFFLVFPLVAQEEKYTLSEAELLRLEKISESLEMNRRNQQLQVRSLKVRLTEALKKSEGLNIQLHTERETLKSLRQSCAEYEREVNIKIEECEDLIDKLKTKLHKTKLTLLIIFFILGFLILGNIIFFVLRMKLKFL